MAGKAIGFPNNQDKVYPVPMFHPSSNAHHVSAEPSFVRAQEPRCSTRLRSDRLSELSASIAHQLSQPVTSMLANAQAAKRWLSAVPPNPMEAIASMDRIVRDARTAGETIQRIPALFKPEPLDRREANIPDVISEAVRLILEDPNKREVPIRWCSDENLPKVWVDRRAIQEVFINLISNALEALENNRNSPLVKIQAAVNDENEMVIQVSDNGPGIGDTEEIFDAFVTTKENGLGIGLTVSRSIAKAHGGRLWAENNPSGGATFCLALPIGGADSLSLLLARHRFSTTTTPEHHNSIPEDLCFELDPAEPTRCP